MERPTRSAGGGWDDFADSGFDPDSDVEAAERTQMAVSNRATKAAKRRTPALPEPLPEFESTPNEFASDDLPPSEEEVADSEPENEGVVGSYLTGTSVLIGCVF
jgi:hypothetical protein